jgi:hypothetical protein
MGLPGLAAQPLEDSELEIWRDGSLITRAEMEAGSIAIESYFRENITFSQIQDKAQR